MKQHNESIYFVQRSLGTLTPLSLAADPALVLDRSRDLSKLLLKQNDIVEVDS